MDAIDPSKSNNNGNGLKGWVRLVFGAVERLGAGNVIALGLVAFVLLQMAGVIRSPMSEAVKVLESHVVDTKLTTNELVMTLKDIRGEVRSRARIDRQVCLSMAKGDLDRIACLDLQ